MGLSGKTARHKDIERIDCMLKMAFGHTWEIGYSVYELHGIPQYLLALRQRRKRASQEMGRALSAYLIELTIHYSNIGYALR